MNLIGTAFSSISGLWDRLPCSRKKVVWPFLAALAALAILSSTWQTGINGSVHAYATDVGEIQNALPRWGIIHRSGYPQYSAIGSLFVTVLRTIGIEPAAGASLFSALWGAVSVGLIVALGQELGVSGPASLLGALLAGVTTSFWVFSSLAEVHTLTLVLSLCTLLYAARFGRTGEHRDLLLLALFFSQGVVHQRSVILLAPGVLVWIWPQWKAVWRGLGRAAGVAMLAPLTYLYLPFRVWTGATWVFGSPGTWKGFWLMVFDNRASRVVKSQADPEEWRRRLEVVLRLLREDMPWPVLVLGLTALLLLALKKGGLRHGIALTVVWIPNLALTYLIWRGRVVDAQLAAMLPVMVLAGIGLAVLLDWLGQHWRPAGIAAASALVVATVVWGWTVRPFVLSITRDPSGEAVVATAARASPPPDDRPTTLVSTWGLDYWALAYAQEYRGELAGLNLVDHNADLRGIVERGDRLLILSKILHVFPVPRWEARLGRLYLSSVAPGVIEISPTPPLASVPLPPGPELDLENGIAIRSASVEWTGASSGSNALLSDQDELWVTVYWEALQDIEVDYSVAVHLLARDPPQGPADILAQGDSVHPVDGWYPTSRWSPGEIVCDVHLVPVPQGSSPVAVRVALYRSDPQAGFINSPWLSLPAP